MLRRCQHQLIVMLLIGLGTCAMNAGCYSHQLCRLPCDGQLPRELEKVSLPAYVIEPPDILLIDALRVVPLPPYRIEALDQLLIRVMDTLTEPIAGIYVVQPDGTVNLGLSYGSVRVIGMTLDEAREAITKYLRQRITAKDVSVELAQGRAMQQIRGEHLVRQDGTISLGLYGGLAVAGMTIPEAKAAIEDYLSQFLLKPEISLDVQGYNSKVYYVIFDGGGFGQRIFRLPVTGNETVLDAIAQLYGLPPEASKRCIWLARPAPAGSGTVQRLPVDWVAITERGSTETNYQILPGDRVYVKADSLITLDNWVNKIVAPAERGFGVTLLGQETIQSIRNPAFLTGTGVAR